MDACFSKKYLIRIYANLTIFEKNTDHILGDHKL